MKIISALLLLVCSTGFLTTKKENKIRGVKVTTFFPLIDPTADSTKYDTIKNYIYYYGDQVACNFSYHYDSAVNDEFIVSEWRHFYFVYTMGNKYGCLFGKYAPFKDEKIIADSILQSYWPSVLVDSSLSETRNHVSLLDKKYNADSGILTEQYGLIDKHDSSINGSMILQYTNSMRDIPYSFSTKLDNSRHMKLFYSKTMVNPILYGKNKKISSFNLEYKFEEIPITNKSELMRYFKRDRELNKK